ncbi:hypothetical protein DMH08_30165 [Actinomadura sp. WAC 06369]|nr:hypothetical protein DMH08_30165 [Actinomadura sp. WAC 06369]
MGCRLLPKSNRARAMAAGAVLLAVVAVLDAVCVLGDEAAAPLPDGERRPAPVRFGESPMWTTRDLGMVEAAGIGLHGGTAVVAGDAGGRDRLAVTGLRTGEPRWVLESGEPLLDGDGAHADAGPGALRGAMGEPLAYGRGDDWSVLVRYAGKPPQQAETGVAALSGEDGGVRWKRALARPGSGGDGPGPRVRLLAADTRAILASVEAERGARPKTVALDPATGRVLWEHEGGWAYRFAGDAVLGETRGEQPPAERLGPRRTGTDVFALDVRSGRMLWDSGDVFDSAHLDAVAGDTAVVDVTEPEPGRMLPDYRTVLLDSATGRVRGYADRLRDCADDGRTLIACSTLHGRLATVRSGTGGKVFTAETPPFDERTSFRVSSVWRDRIFVTEQPGGLPRQAMVDRAANRLGPVPSDGIAALSPDAAAFEVDDGDLAVVPAAVGRKPAEAAEPAEPAPRPPGIATAPLWRAEVEPAPDPPGRDTGLSRVIDIELAGDSVVYTGPRRDHDETDTQVVADAGTGKVRWSVAEGAPLGGGAEAADVLRVRVVSAGGERLSLVRYRASGGAEGVAALSLDDGGVRWKKEVVRGDGFVSLAAAGDEAFAVEISSAVRGGEDIMAVYATGTRRELWRERGMTPESIGGGLVLAAETARDEEGKRKPRDLVAYGTADGEPRWRLGDRYREPGLLYDGGGAAVVGTADGGAVLDRATGRELARTVRLRRCEGDGGALIVCEAGAVGATGPVGRAVTVRVRDGAARVRDLLETGSLSLYGAAGDWFTAVHRPDGVRPGGEGERFLLLDAAGRRVSDGLPGRPATIGGGFAVLTPSEIVHRVGGSGVRGFAVHRVRG